MNSQVLIKDFPDANLMGTYYAAAPTNKKAAVVIGCAMGITQKYYHNLAEFLSECGFTVLTFDYRGTGLSAPKRLRGYEVTLFDWADDLSDALCYLKTKHPQDDLIFIGHSIASQLFGFVDEKPLVKRAIFLASSTGYWRDGIGMSKWKNLFLLSVVMPFSNLVWGYTNARFFGQGENYPKGPSMQWRKWCLHPAYFGVETNPGIGRFADYTGEIKSFYFKDDPIANRKSASKLMDVYANATKVLMGKSPADFKQRSVGHTGFLSRKFKATFWHELASQ